MGFFLKQKFIKKKKKKKENNLFNEKHFELYMKKEKTTVESFFIIPSKLFIKFNLKEKYSLCIFEQAAEQF